MGIIPVLKHVPRQFLFTTEGHKVRAWQHVIEGKQAGVPMAMATSSGDGSRPPKSLALSMPVTRPVVSASVGRPLLSTLRYVSGFSGEESLHHNICWGQCFLRELTCNKDTRLITTNSWLPCLMLGVEAAAYLLESASAVSKGSLWLPCMALLYVSIRAFEDCLRFMLPGQWRADVALRKPGDRRRLDIELRLRLATGETSVWSAPICIC